MRKFLVVAALAVSGSAFAGGYGMAGCGLGSMVLGDSKGIMQIFAATLNATGLQTVGITLGTSNCTDTESGAKSAKVFIEGNRDQLAKDISRGSGDALAHLTELVGCGDSKAVGTKLQSNFKAIFPSESTSNDDVAKSILGTLKAEKALACTNVG